MPDAGERVPGGAWLVHMYKAASATFALQVDGHDLFLLAGDLPYYDLPRRRWDEALAALRAAHFNAVTISAPWSWHEPQEGEIDLSGETDPQRDLAGALALCARQGLRVIFSPGPHVGGSWHQSDLPQWLLRAHPEVLALDAHGRGPALEVGCPALTCLHPVYAAYVAGWYQALLPILRRAQGLLVAVRLDGRASGDRGLGDDPLAMDYGPRVVGEGGRAGFYQQWLAAQYGEVQRLNERYQASYDSFAQVQPPRRQPASRRELPWFSDWRRCKMDLFNQHLEYLYDWLHDGGLDVPVAILFPYRSPLGARRCADYFRLRGKPVLVAHASTAAPTGSRPDLGSAIAGAELARYWVRDTPYPPANLETPVYIDGRDGASGLEALCTLQLGHGLNALSLALAAGGPSPRGDPRPAPLAALSPPAEPLPSLLALRRLGEFLALHGERVLATEPLADVAVGWYEPYEDCGRQGNAHAFGWRDDYRQALDARFGLWGDRAAPHAGLLGEMALAGLNYCMLDLERDPLEEWLGYPQLWVPGLDFMAAAVQQELVSYVEAGGHLVMLPRVPLLDEHLQPRQLLRALFPGQPLRPQTGPLPEYSRLPYAVVLEDGCGLDACGSVDTFALPPTAEALAWEWQSCLPCAYRRGHGRGTATLLGFVPAPSLDGQPGPGRLLGLLAGEARVGRHAWSEAQDLYVVERATPPGPRASGFLFVANGAPAPVRSRLTYTDPVTRQPARLPRVLDGLELPGPGALILCLEVPIPGTGLTIAYATSQVQGWTAEGGRVALTLHGPPGTMGEIAFRLGPNAAVPAVQQATRSERLADARGALHVVTYAHEPGATVLRIDA